MPAHNISNSSLPLTAVQQQALRTLLEKGLPLTSSPYQTLAQQIDSNAEQVLSQITQWQDSGLIKRFGVVVKHRQLGYVANAMVVWNIPDAQVDEIAEKLAKRREVSLCYRRPRRLPDWPYNLFCMIHGKSRQRVLAQIGEICQALDLQSIEKDVLFSNKAYKQQGGRYLSKVKVNAKAKPESSFTSATTNSEIAENNTRGAK